MRRHLSADALILLGLFLLPLAIFWQVTLGGRTLLPADNLYQFQPYAAARESLGAPDVAHNMLLSDLALENLEWKTFIRDSLSRGEIPLWNPHLFAGVPFLAAGQHSALYPFSLIYYILPLERAYGWFTVTQLWLAGAFMFAFLRGLGVRRAGAAIGAIAYQLSGFFLASVVFQMIIAAAAWLPFLLLMVEFTIQRRPIRGRPATLPWVALGALGLGMTILAGHVEFVYYSLLVMGFWAALRLAHLALARAQPFSQLARTGGALLALVALGLALGAVQLVPLYELVNSSSREGRASFDDVRGYALPPRHALTFLMPNLFGNPSQHEYFDVFTGQTTPIDWQIGGVRVTDSMMPGGKNYVEGAAYVGILTLALAGVALLSGLSRRARWPYAGPYRAILAALALVSLAFAFGTLAYALLYYGLPGFNQLHSPFRWVFPLTLCLAALAGFGVDQIQRSKEGVGVRAIAVALIALGIFTLAALLVSRALFPQVRGAVETLYTSLAGATLAYPNAEVFYSVKFRDVLLFAAFATASGAALLALRRPRGAWIAAGVLALDLIVASAGFNPAADPRWLDYEPPSLAWLRAQEPHNWRLTAVQGPSATLNANIPWLFGLHDVRGYDSIIPRQYVAYMERIQPQTQLLYNRIAPVFPDTLSALDSPWLDRLAVRYVMVEIAAGIDLAQTSGYREAYRDEAVIIYENPDAMPRAALLDVAQCADADSAAPVESDARLAGASGLQVTVDVTVPAGGGRCLVLADSYAPGWRAYVRPLGAAEDEETEFSIARVWGNFRGVALEPGAWSVRFRYSPPSFQVGAFVSFLALASLLFGLMVWVWRALGAGGAAQNGSGVQRFARNSLAPIALNLFNRGIDLAFAFIMLRLLGPANAGIYYYAVVIFGWFDILTNFGLNTLLTREVARDRASAGRFLLNSSLLRLGLAALGAPLLAAFLLLRGALPPPLDGVSVAAIILLYIGLIPGSISTGLSALFYAFEKAETPAAISTVTAILKAAFGLGALAAGWGVIGL
ncbi:MAG: oligosaccharide flippase family protein, partial [Anaerolineae bacterium]|nr:oligosaccharide flippase family protein [Anaerolineae bacterium]